MELRNALQVLENIDALKNTYRQCLIMNSERRESTAEHSFSLAMAVMMFAGFANEPIDVEKSVKMALSHDLAEALMGDTFHYAKETAVHEMSEMEALKKLLQPIAGEPLFEEICSAWDEFEHGASAEAVFLRGLDRFLPMYHNYKTNGHTWLKHRISKAVALEKNAHIEQSSAKLWEFTRAMLDESQAKGWIL